MRPLRLWAIVVVFALLTFSGCVQKGSKNHVSVMFAGKPLLFENSVFLNGMVVGKIESVKVGQANIAKVDFVPLNGFRDRLADNLIFFVSNGRLNVARVKKFGYPVKNGKAFLGFRSKPALYWFKIKHALGDPGLAASTLASFLSDQFHG